MVVKLLQNKRIVFLGDKDRIIKFFKDNNITPEEVRSWFSSPCCSVEDLRVDIQDSFNIIRYCTKCKTKQKISKKENLFIKLYSEDTLPMNKEREKIFRVFITCYEKEYLISKHPDGYITECIFCKKGKLLINKFTGNTYCYHCKKERPFELIFEELQHKDIFSIVQEIRNNSKTEEEKQRPTEEPKIKIPVAETEKKETQGLKLNKRCVVCNSDNWVVLSRLRKTTAIQCLNCEYVELLVRREI